jgi:hypothetical protein
MTPSGIEPATFRFVTQYLNQLCHRLFPYLLQWLCETSDYQQLLPISVNVAKNKYTYKFSMADGSNQQ